MNSTPPPESGIRDLGQNRPHSARVYDYFLNGKTHYAVDREVAERLLEAFPGFRTAARANRAWMHRAARFLTDRGIRQFLDIGTGIPTRPNLHEVVQEVAPDSRVVYVDNDPIVLAHARALLDSTPEGRTAYLEADITGPAAILESAELRETLDFGEPVALCLVGLFHYITDEQDPYGIVRQLVDALPSGSYLAFSHCTPDFAPEEWEMAMEFYKQDGGSAQVRSRSEIEKFFSGLDLVEPGVVVPHRWYPDEDTLRQVEAGTLDDASVSLWVGVARKP
ncbi:MULTISPECIES: SAM-dependent methyltransferase [Streptomyces]|nr:MULTISPECIES: SAM-dependent methyltransferase [Streptomyces]